MIILRQLLDHQSKAYSYLLGCENSREALMIDPVFSQLSQYLRLLDELQLSLKAVLVSHLDDHAVNILFQYIF